MFDVVAMVAIVSRAFRALEMERRLVRDEEKFCSRCSSRLR